MLECSFQGELADEAVCEDRCRRARTTRNVAQPKYRMLLSMRKYRTLCIQIRELRANNSTDRIDYVGSGWLSDGCPITKNHDR